MHITSSRITFSWNCPLETSIMIWCRRHSFKDSQFHHSCIFFWPADIFKFEFIIYSSCIPSWTVSKFYSFIFMSIGNSIGITCVVYYSCSICFILILHSKYFYFVRLLWSIFPFFSQITEFLIQYFSRRI